VKPVRLSKHASGYFERRGFSAEEVEECICQSEWQRVDGTDRFECKRNFSFAALWNGKYYETKQVRPIFVEEEREIVVITVYTYYF
jgi:hypothetical protein